MPGFPALALLITLPLMAPSPAPLYEAPQPHVTSALTARSGLALASDPAESEATPPDLSGRFAQKLVTTARAKVMGVGRVDTTTTAYLIVEVEQEGTRLRMKSRACNATLDGSRVVRTTIPDAFVESLPERTRRGTLRRDNDAWVLDVARDWDIRGVRLRDPANETLPEDADDPRVFDQDGDGHPGLSVQVEGLIDGEVRVVQRGWDEYSFPVQDPDHLRGSVRWNSEQSVVDATSRFLRGGPEAEPLSNPDLNYVELKRVAPSVDCQALKSRPDAVFSD